MANSTLWSPTGIAPFDWTSGSNWNTTIPNSVTGALFGDASGYPTINTGSCQAQYVIFGNYSNPALINGAGVSPLLTLYPLGGTALQLEGTALTLDNFTLALAESGLFTATVTGPLTVQNGAVITGSASTLTCAGSLTLNVYTESFLASSSGTYSNNSLILSGINLNNQGFVGYAGGGAIANISIGQNAQVSNRGYLALTDTSKNSTIGTVSLTSGSVTNLGIWGSTGGPNVIQNVLFTGGRFFNAADSSDCGIAFFGGTVNTVSISGSAQIINNGYIGVVDANPHSTLGTVSISGGSITNNYEIGFIAGAGTFGQLIISGGTIVNTGYIGDAAGGGIINALNFTGGHIVNEYVYGFAESGSQIKQITLSGSASVVNNGYFITNDPHGTISSVTMSGGSVTNNSWFAFSPQTSIGNITMTGGIIFNEAGAYMGACPITIRGGAIFNNGSLSVTGTSGIYSPSIQGFGELYVAGNLQVLDTFFQDTVHVGKILALNNDYDVISQSAAGTLTLCNLFGSNIHVWSAGQVVVAQLTLDDTLTTSDIVVDGNIDVETGGILTLGTEEVAGNFSMTGALTFSKDSKLDYNIGSYGGSSIVMAEDSVVTLDQPICDVTVFSKAVMPFQQIFLQFALSEEQSYSGTITGNFTVVSSQPLVDVNLSIVDNNYVMFAQFAPFASVAANPNQTAVSQALDLVNGQTNNCLQNKIDMLQLESIDTIDQALTQMQSAFFKGQQVVLEELTFAINDELNSQLRFLKQGFRPFLSLGYRHFNQLTNSYLNGFHAGGSFGLIGATYGFKKTQLAAAFGGSQTSTQYKNAFSKSSSASALATLGFNSFVNRWSFNLDALFSYNFLSIQRQIDLYKLQARSNHGGYMFKGAFGARYTKQSQLLTFSPYDQLSYLYGLEGSYQEKGAACINLSVASSQRQVIRNALGFSLDIGDQMACSPYFDIAYVYEYRFGGSHYKTRFINTAPVMNLQGITTDRNFAKLALGIKGALGSWDYRFNLDAQYGKNLRQAGIVASIAKSF